MSNIYSLQSSDQIKDTYDDINTNFTNLNTDKADKVVDLSQFASTTSAQLDSVISDSIGSGSLVFGVLPTIQGYLTNGKINVSVASNNIIVSILTASGSTPSSTNPVFCRIGDTVRTISSALSITKNAGTNWFNAGSSELATFEIDYFVYLGYNATDGVTIGFSRLPFAHQYSDFSATTTNERYCAISTITNASSTDYYELIGRFPATLSAGAGYTWSVPTFTPNNLIQRPIYETRLLTYAPTITGYSSNPTSTYYRYKINGSSLYIKIREGTAGTSNATTTTYTTPFTENKAQRWQEGATAVDNNVATASPALARIASGVNVINMYKDFGETVWTGSGNKRIQDCNLYMEI